MIGIIGSETTKNYCLFKDLEGVDSVKIYYTNQPYGKDTLVWSLLHRVIPSTMDKIKVTMSWGKKLLSEIGKYDSIIIVDTALRWLQVSFLLKCREKNPNLIVKCLLLNSVSSLAFSEDKIQTAFDSFTWDEVLTFDPGDAEKHNWKYIGLHYYSKLDIKVSDSVRTDAFFAGSLAGKRGKEIQELLAYLNEHDVKCDFLCPRLSWRQKFSKLPAGLRLLRRRIPYKDVLQSTLTSNCIIEILQENQCGSSLRYFEAVCFNKKLITTNTQIVNYPFYDERYMKVFRTSSDIDCQWIKEKEKIDYGYRDEFSPKYLLSPESSL